MAVPAPGAADLAFGLTGIAASARQRPRAVGLLRPPRRGSTALDLREDLNGAFELRIAACGIA
jgi:hypothetical protein